MLVVQPGCSLCWEVLVFEAAEGASQGAEAASAPCRLNVFAPEDSAHRGLEGDCGTCALARASPCPLSVA